ncbi:type VII secretion target [Amycolatopsis samaneae]|uniref:Type VII secretion target n=1 Tax=Amycolatopsis samaneae TaxID=664691 RepID=A0ABW5GQY0_9PSEU
MTPPKIHMEPPQIDQAGADLAAVAEEAGRITAALFTSGDNAVRGNNGWQSSPALATCGGNWREHVKALETTTSALAWKVRTSARLYHATDQEAEKRLVEVLQNMGRR